MIRRLISLVVLLMLHATTSHAEAVTVVADLDLNRYTGKWFEIARFPNKFQTQCVGDVSATYVKRDDGDMDVINRCKNVTGLIEEAVGRARVPSLETTAKLKVRFAPQWLSWLPMVWADYWVVELAPDYSIAVVGDPTRKYLWVLSRRSAIDEPVYQSLLKRLDVQGYDTNSLVLTPQGGSKQAPASR